MNNKFVRSRLIAYLVIPLIVLLVTIVGVFSFPSSRESVLAYLNNERFESGKPVSHWINNLSSDDSKVREEAADTLGHVGPEVTPDAVPPLTELLNDQIPSVRKHASLALAKMGPLAKPALPGLIKALKDSNLFVRLNAALALTNMGVESVDAIPALIEALKDPANDARVMAPAFNSPRKQMVTALGCMGPRAKAAVPDLVVELKCKEYEMAVVASVALGKIKDIQAIPGLIALLEHQLPTVRSTVAGALGEFGSDAKVATPKLAKLLNSDPDPDVKRTAAQVLGKIASGDKVTLDALIKALKDQDDILCNESARALGNLGPAAKPAVPALNESLKSENFVMRRYAAEALRKIEDPGSTTASP